MILAAGDLSDKQYGFRQGTRKKTMWVNDLHIVGKNRPIKRGSYLISYQEQHTREVRRKPNLTQSFFKVIDFYPQYVCNYLEDDKIHILKCEHQKDDYLNLKKLSEPSVQKTSLE